MAVRVDVPINISAEFLGQALLDAAIGKLEKLEQVSKFGSNKTQPFEYEFKFTQSGERIFTTIPAQLNNIDAAYDKAVAAAKQYTQVQEGSLTNLRQSVNALKQQRDALVKTSPEWAAKAKQVKAAEDRLLEYNGVQQGSIAYLQRQKSVLVETARNENLTAEARYRHTQAINDQNAAIRRAQGIQRGSLADLRAQRAEILALRDATAKLPNLSGPPNNGGGPTWNDLNNQLKQIDGQINRLTPAFGRLVKALGTIATVQAGFVAVTTALRALGGLVNSYTSRTKEIESFNLALRNIGLTQAETTGYFKEATATANALGAPVQQLEKSYKRMIPALIAVGASSEESSKFIEAISARTQTLGLNTEQSGRLLEAFAQVLSKGKLQSEELNQQISELDGAFRTQLADAIGVSSEQLNELIENSAVTSDVFVKAVIKMENGAEELKKRIEEGNGTIQQLQNLINNINVETISQIGAQIEPLIKSFINIGKAVAEFFNEFQRTDAFKLFVTVLNQSAKGAEVFVGALLNVVKAVVSLLQPLAVIANAILGLGDSFGGIIGIIINVVGGLVSLKAAILAISAIKNAASSLQSFSGEMVKLGTAAETTEVKLTGIRKAFRTVSDFGGGIAGSLLGAVNSFLGISKAAEDVGRKVEGASTSLTKIKTVSDLQKASISDLTAEHLDLSYQLKEGAISAEEAQSKLDSLNAKTEENAKQTSTAKTSTVTYGNAMEQASAKTDRFTGSVNKAGASLTNLGRQVRIAGSAIKGVLVESFLALVNPLTIAIQLLARFIELLNAQKKAAAGVDASFSDVYLSLQKTLKDTAPASAKVTESVQKTTAELDKQNNTTQKTGGLWRNVAIGFGIAGLAAATVLTGGIAAAGIAAGATGAKIIGAGIAAVGFGKIAAATGGILITMGVSANTAEKAIENLEKAGEGKALVKNWKEVDKQLGAVRARIEGLGQEINSTDFSKYAEGSVNLNLLQTAYSGLAQGLRENIELEKQRLQELAKSGKLTDAERAAIEARISKYEEELKLRLQQVEAVQSEIASRIAQKKAVDASTLSLEELNRAQKLVNEAIDTEKIKAQTAALRQYGQLQADEYKLAAANLAIEQAAGQQRLEARQQELNLLLEKQRLTGVLSAEEKAKVLELTKTIEEENYKQVEIQAQLGQAIADAFERGIRNAQRLGDIAGEVTGKFKSVFDGVASGLQSGIQTAVSLLDTALENELFGVEENSQIRKNAALFQLRITAEMNNLEYTLAKLKLDTSYRLAQNEARIAQLRLKAEAEIAAARGENKLAESLYEAADAQNLIIAGLADQYKIDQQVLKIGKMKSDASLVQRGLQAGIAGNAESVAKAIGVQNVKTRDVIKEMRVLDKSAKDIATKWSAITTSQSNYQKKVESGAVVKGEKEAKAISDAFYTAKGYIQDATRASDGLVRKFSDMSKYTGKVKEDMRQIAALATGGTSRRAMGGPVTPGQQYLVNDGGGREGFVNKFGKFSLLPPGRNIKWSPSTVGTVIPADLTKRYQENSTINNRIKNITTSKSSVNTTARASGSSLNPGTLLRQIASSVSNSTNSRVTNNVTIQSQKPVADASKLMTDLAKMKLRSSRRGI